MRPFRGFQELDQIFLAAAERAGGIQPLLTSFFGFLHRRTDFYIEHGGVKGRAYDAGFAPGQAEAMVRAAFMAHPTRPLEGSNVERSAAAHRAGAERRRRTIARRRVTSPLRLLPRRHYRSPPCAFAVGRQRCRARWRHKRSPFRRAAMAACQATRAVTRAPYPHETASAKNTTRAQGRRRRH